MALTPDDIESWRFSGDGDRYDAAEVRELLRRVADHLRVVEAAAVPEGTSADEASIVARRRLLQAISEANALIKRAEAERDRLLDEAKESGERIRRRLVRTRQVLVEAQAALSSLHRPRPPSEV